MISSVSQIAVSTGIQSLRNLPAIDPTLTAGAEAGPATEAPQSDTPNNGAGRLSEKEQREVEALRKRDREVKAHEQAHLAAAGGYARGGPQYTYQVGPDGKRYAVGGEVPIDVSEVPGDPMATLQKAMTIRRAALAPNNPSAADRAIAAKAAAMAARARQEMARSQGEESGQREAGAPEATALSAGEASAAHDSQSAAGRFSAKMQQYRAVQNGTNITASMLDISV